MDPNKADLDLSLVIPCFNEEEVISKLGEVLKQTLSSRFGTSWEVIFVDDGSTDATWPLIQALQQSNPRFKGLRLSRNFGHQKALTAGLAYPRGRFVGIIDADLQDPPEELIKCYELAKAQGHDVVYGVRKRLQVNFILQFCYKIFYRLMASLSDQRWPLDAGDFCVMSRRAVSLLNSLPERARILRGLRSWIGLKQGFHEYARPVRRLGKSKYNILKLTGLATDSLVSFSSAPLRLASIIGLTTSLLTALLGFILLINRLFPYFTLFNFWIGLSPGVTTIVLIVLFANSLTFFCLGILGEYLAVILREVKQRPEAIIFDKTGSLEKIAANPTVRELGEE